MYLVYEKVSTGMIGAEDFDTVLRVIQPTGLHCMQQMQWAQVRVTGT